MRLSPNVLAAVARGTVIWTRDGRVEHAVPPHSTYGNGDPARHTAAIIEELGPSGGSLAPLSQSQQVLRHLGGLELSHESHNLAAAIRIRSNVDADRLGSAVHTCALRHPPLRMSIVATEDGQVRCVKAWSAVVLGAIDATAWSVARLRAEIAEAQRAPFDLESRLVRLLLYTRAPDDHVLLLAAHHLAADALALRVLLDELALAYAGNPLSETTYDARSEIVCELAALGGTRGEAIRNRWRAALDGNLPALDLPFDRARKRERRSGASVFTFEVDPETRKRLAQFALDERAAMSEILLAAFVSFLSRHTGEREIVLGALLPGRPSREKPAIDRLDRPVPVRIDLGEDAPAFRHVLDLTRAALREAESSESLPLSVLVDDRPPGFTAVAGAIFRTSFSFREIPEFAATESWPAEPFALDPLAVPSDLRFDMSSADRLAGVVQYRPDLFDDETIACFVERFTILLRGAIENPGCAVSRLPLLGERDRERLVEWNRTGAPAARAISPVRAFERRAAEAPEAVAVIEQETITTYGSLNESANRLARLLIERGAGPGTRVAVCLERDTALVAVLLAVMKTGAAYVPLDPAYPLARLRFMCEDADATLLVTHSSVAPIFEHGNTVFLDEVAGELARRECGDCGVLEDASAPAYLLFTSGSTGKPKGVVATYGNISSFVGWAREAFGPEDLSGVFAATSVCFDLSVFELFVPLSAGGTVILGATAFELMTLPHRDDVTLVNTVPSVMGELLRIGPLPASVRVVNLAGEPLSRDLASAIVAVTGRHDLVIYNLYGPTEATVYATYARVDLHDDRQPPIGRAISGTSTYVLDGALGLVPPGVVGELFIGGPGVTLGYWQRPDLTDLRFLPDPFVAEPGHRMFRTGDRVRYRGDGSLEFFGRSDHQVKIRGFRVELGEIEAALRTHASVRDAVVVSRPRENGSGRLIGYIVMDDDAPEVDNAALRRHLATTLPDYMRPAQFVRLATLPLTMSGKIDRPALPKPPPGGRLTRSLAESLPSAYGSG